MSKCFHCGLPVPKSGGESAVIDGEHREFCCVSCRMVALAIVDGGMGKFYEFRDDLSRRPDGEATSYSAFDLSDVQSEFVTESGGVSQTQLLVDGISCAACVWLIEHQLQRLEGIVAVRVNASTHRCIVQWQSDRQKLSEIMAALHDIGYKPMLANEDQQQAHRENENRHALMRLAVAGFGMMQAGMVAVALYAGASDDEWRDFFRWVSLIIATPVVLYSAKPFFIAAWRALKSRHLVMDLPVSIAIGGAYSASVWATVSQGGEVYFDSVSMFTFFLLIGRYLEMRVRHRNGIESSRLAQLLPASVPKMSDEGWQEVPIRDIQETDIVLVAAGAILPCDGVVIDGRSGVVEALLTGESEPVEKIEGSSVIAGSQNTDSPLRVRVTATGSNTQLSAIEHLVDQAQLEKPSQVAMADKLAGYFVGGVLLVAVIVFFSWWQIDSDRALWITLSVLVVTCPCALSLAAPTALTVAVAWLRNNGLLVTKGHVIEGLNQVDMAVFDKTGTLTEGRPNLSKTHVMDSDYSPEHCAAIAAALEEGAKHPIARAFELYAGHVQAEEIKQETGSGVEGIVDQQRFRIGKVDYASSDSALKPPTGAGQWLLLGKEDILSKHFVPVCWFCLLDEVRDSAISAVNGLKRLNIQPVLLSGDGSSEVERVADLLGIDTRLSGQSPAQKLEFVKSQQQSGNRILMVGDGINDVPVLSGADISVAMSGATDLAQTKADSVMLGGELTALNNAILVASRTRKIIRQNLSWALGYNLLALPLAAFGLVPPYAAAIGMSLSSLLVVSNALRLTTTPSFSD